MVYIKRFYGVYNAFIRSMYTVYVRIEFLIIIYGLSNPIPQSVPACHSRSDKLNHGQSCSELIVDGLIDIVKRLANLT
jgi:hypothetical protein